MIVAKSDDGTFIASDIPAILKHTDKYILLNDNEITHLTKDNITIYNERLNILNKKTYTYNGSIEDISKQDYEHYMLKEIYEQPEVIKNTLLPFLNNKQKLTFLVKVGDAVTNDSGTIEYSNFNSGKLLTSKYKISELAKTPKQKVVVKPGSSKIVLLNLKIPKSDFPGTLAGGVYVERLNNAKTKAKKGIVTQNHFAMTLPILLTKHPKAKRIAKMVLDKVKVTKGPVIKAQLSNVNPVIFGQLMINAKIKPLNQNKTIVQKKVQGYQVAPNSTFNFLISQNSSKLKAGKYTLDILMKSGKRRWHYVKNFEIKTNQVVPLNKRIKLNNLSIIMWIIMIGLILLIIALVIVILIQRRIMKLRK